MSKIHQNPLYFIALMPPENIRIEIENFKKEIKENYGVEHALKLPAHLTLKIPFRMDENLEDVLTGKIQDFCKGKNIFEVEIDGFGSFSKKVIFIKVVDHKPLIELHRAFQKLTSEIVALKSHEIASNIHPHLSIATRDLKRSDFPHIWNNFEKRQYSASFMAKKIFLFKHNGKTWDIIRKIQLAT